MKAIISGKRYNTDTATEVASYSNNLGGRDFKHFDETLYVSPRGNWFLAGQGGPMTKYSRPAGNMYTGGAGIIPLDAEEARDWLERYGFTQAIENYFADSIEDA